MRYGAIAQFQRRPRERDNEKHQAFVVMATFVLYHCLWPEFGFMSHQATLYSEINVLDFCCHQINSIRTIEILSKLTTSRLPNLYYINTKVNKCTAFFFHEIALIRRTLINNNHLKKSIPVQ